MLASIDVSWEGPTSLNGSGDVKEWKLQTTLSFRLVGVLLAFSRPSQISSPRYASDQISRSFGNRMSQSNV